MQGRAVIAVSAVVLLVAVGAVSLVAQAASAPGGKREGKARQFVGYWMGIDPLDGGDSRRGLTRNPNGTFALIGRDTVFTLCDGSDRAIVSAELRLAGSRLVSDDFLIECTNGGSEVRLRARYSVLDRGIIRETLTTQAGEPVDEIIFHRVSER